MLARFSISKMGLKSRSPLSEGRIAASYGCLQDLVLSPQESKSKLPENAEALEDNGIRDSELTEIMADNTEEGGMRKSPHGSGHFERSVSYESLMSDAYSDLSGKTN